MELNLIPQLLLLQNPVGIIRKWSDEDTQLFIKLYPDTNNRILAVKFKRSISSIKNRAKAGKSLSKTRRSEKARVYIGLEQKTNLKIK